MACRVWKLGQVTKQEVSTWLAGLKGRLCSEESGIKQVWLLFLKVPGWDTRPISTSLSEESSEMKKTSKMGPIPPLPSARQIKGLFYPKSPTLIFS
jgi:hypothetical protein